MDKLSYIKGLAVAMDDDLLGFKKHREAEKLTDSELLDIAKELVVKEKNKLLRDNLYFIIGNIIANLENQEAVNFLIGQLEKESDKNILHSMLILIGDIRRHPKPNIAPLIKLTKDKRWLVRHAAIEALSCSKEKLAESVLIDILNTSEDTGDIISANATLNIMGTSRAIPALSQHLKSRKRDVKLSAESAIDEIQKREQASPSDL